jgi:hypothetical protein
MCPGRVPDPPRVRRRRVVILPAILRDLCSGEPADARKAVFLVRAAALGYKHPTHKYAIFTRNS